MGESSPPTEAGPSDSASKLADKDRRSSVAEADRYCITAERPGLVFNIAKMTRERKYIDRRLKVVTPDYGSSTALSRVCGRRDEPIAENVDFPITNVLQAL